MSVGMPSDAVLRELESRHDDLLKQLNKLDKQVLRVLSTCQEYRGRPPQAEDEQETHLGCVHSEGRIDFNVSKGRTHRRSNSVDSPDDPPPRELPGSPRTNAGRRELFYRRRGRLLVHRLLDSRFSTEAHSSLPRKHREEFESKAAAAGIPLLVAPGNPVEPIRSATSSIWGPSPLGSGRQRTIRRRPAQFGRLLDRDRVRIVGCPPCQYRRKISERSSALPRHWESTGSCWE